MADAWLFTSSWFVGPGGASSIRNRPIGLARTLTRFDLSHENVRYVVMVAVVAAAWFGAVNIRDSKTGRAFFAVRGSEIAAASLGVDVTRTKLTAFAISGALTGLAGNLLMTGTRTATPVNFQFSVSLFYLGVAVVGGITSLGGAVASSLAFAGLTELFFRVRALNGWLDVVTTGLLLGVILAYPGGLGALAGRRRDVASPEIGREPARAATRARTPARERPPGEPVLAVAGLSVRFGGLVAVDDVSLDVRGGEIAGLIGPNGAGKTTLFDTVLGLTTPSDGTVWMFGRDVTHLPVHARARTGVARTFQLVQVLGALTTFDNLLIATHGRDGTGLASHLFVTQRAIDAEAAARARVRDVLDLLELTAVAGRRVADLPFGVLRRIELARALVSGARLLLLDEPSSGLDTAETDRMAEVIASIPGETGASILLIEHDVRLVRAVCGHVYVIDGGKIVAQGPPEAVVRDPAVVAAYLGR
jgi:branched-chain amino acid transport system permease protein